MSKTILVYADWKELSCPEKVGILRTTFVRGKEHFSFIYDNKWLASGNAQQIDPELALFQGEQHSATDSNFKVFLDSCPDRWGRLLMQRREAARARQEERKPNRLNESDYLLGVHDMYRMGALRFKTSQEGDFLDNDWQLAAPPLASLPELEYAAIQVENRSEPENPEYLRWLNMLMSPGSSLGGARPKASVVDGEDLWLAKFPSRLDDYDIGLWELLIYKLARNAGIEMAECRAQKLSSRHHTFLTKRFDRCGGDRFHFTSAMTQLGYFDGKDDGASYLELAQFLMEKGSNTRSDLAQLWRRILFNIAVSNGDDHLRNHGFLFCDGGWKLSPAYDVNVMPDTVGLHLNIDDLDNSLSYELAFEVAEYFHLSRVKAEAIYDEVMKSVTCWEEEARILKIRREETESLRYCFNLN